jgi:hypothetical protein
MKEKEIEHLLKSYTQLANSFFQKGDFVNHSYWKGQVMGISKVVETLKLDIDHKFYLRMMH